MTYKKNWLSVCLWAFYACSVLVCYAKSLYDVLQAPHVTNHYIQFAIVFLSFALAAVVFIQIRKLANYVKRPVHVLWEALIFVLLFAAGVFLRIYFIGSGTEHAAYFETAMVNGSPVITLAHGAQYFYVLLLRGLFLLTGNHFMAGIILQICLQMTAAFLWYLAVKKCAGRVSALVLFAGFMLMPASIREGLLYSPKMLYMLLCGIVLLLTGCLIERQHRNAAFRWYVWLVAVLTGVGIGVLIYLDVTGILFLLPALFLLFVKGEGKDAGAVSEGRRLGRAALQLFVVVIFALATMLLLLYMDALQNGAGVWEVFATWRTLFSGKEVLGLPSVFTAATALEAWVLVGLTFLMLIGVPAFFIRRKEEVQILWLLFAAAAIALYAGGFCAEGMDCEYLLLTAVLLLTGSGLQAAFCRTKAADEEREEESALPENGHAEQIKTEAAETQQVKRETKSEETPADGESTQKQGTEAQEKVLPETKDKAPEVKDKKPETKETEPEVKDKKPEVKETEPEMKDMAPETKETKPETSGNKAGEKECLKGQEKSEQQSPQEQNQTESDVSQMSYNAEYDDNREKGGQDSLWALFAGDDGAVKPAGGEEEKAAGKKQEVKKEKEKEKKAKEEKAKEKKVKEKKAKEKPQKKAAEKKQTAGKKQTAEDTVKQNPEEKAAEKKNYIENPLPLPKKHVPKTMGYQTEPAPERMDFDIDISDFDDFDI